MRALLVTNSFATATNPDITKSVTNLLSKNFELTTLATTRREEAITFGSQASRDKYDIVITLGGDGTANEVINGLMRLDAAERPAFASLPGGNANVLSRNLGYSREALLAAGELIASVQNSSPTQIGLGQVTATADTEENFSRYFAFNAGIGIDAEVLLAMHDLRNRGKKVSDFAYARLAVRRIFSWMRNSTPQLIIEGKPYFFAFVVNLSPWTYVSNKAIDPAPDVTHSTALSAYAAESANGRAFIAVLKSLALGKRFIDVPSMKAFENTSVLDMATTLPMWLQVDGEPLKLVSQARFSHHPASITVYQSRNGEL